MCIYVQTGSQESVCSSFTIVSLSRSYNIHLLELRIFHSLAYPGASDIQVHHLVAERSYPGANFLFLAIRIKV